MPLAQVPLLHTMGCPMGGPTSGKLVGRLLDTPQSPLEYMFLCGCHRGELLMLFHPLPAQMGKCRLHTYLALAHVRISAQEPQIGP